MNTKLSAINWRKNVKKNEIFPKFTDLCIEATHKSQHDSGLRWEGHKKISGNSTFATWTFSKHLVTDYSVQGGPQQGQVTGVTSVIKEAKEHPWIRGETVTS